MSNMSTSELQAKKIKEGQLLYYKPRIFGSDWRKVNAILYSDSSFFFQTDKSKPAKSLKLGNVAPFIVIGQFTNRLKNRPELPSYANASNLIAIGTGPPNSPVLWFLAPSEEDFNLWWSSILNILPPPPQPPQQPQPQSQSYQPPPYPNQSYPNQLFPPTGGYQQPYGQPQSGYQQPPQSGGPTTVVVAPSPSSGSSGGGGWGTGMGLGTGALLGGVMGYGLGSLASHGMGGWGAGCGYAGYPGYYSDNDTTVINNYYDDSGNVAQTSSYDDDVNAGSYGDSGVGDFDTGFGGFDGDFGADGDW